MYLVHDPTGRAIAIEGTFRDIITCKHAKKDVSKLNQDLVQRVKERTAELEKRTRELGCFNKLFVDRELRMVELKKRIEVLEKELTAKGKG